MRKGKVIAVAGKGGTGKTAIAALFVFHCIKSKENEEIVAILTS